MVIEKLMKKKSDWTVPWENNLRTNERNDRKKKDLANLTKKYSSSRESLIESQLRPEYQKIPFTRNLSSTTLRE